jgi:hypothetical protein
VASHGIPAGSSLASTRWAAGTLNDVVHEGLWALTRSANRSTVKWAQHQVLPAVPSGTAEELGRQRSQAVLFVRYTFLVVANRAVVHVHVEGDIQAPGTRRQLRWVFQTWRRICDADL